MQISKPSEEGTTFEKVYIPVGSHAARIYKLVDMGTQVQTEQVNGVWIDKIKKDFKTQEPILDSEGKTQIVKKEEIAITFEIPSETHDFGNGDKPLVIEKVYPISLHEKAGLTKVVVASLGEVPEVLEIKDLMGKEVMLTIGRTAGGNHKIEGISPVPKGLPVGVAVNETVSFMLDEFNVDLFNTLPEFRRQDIALSPEYENALTKIENAIAEKGDDVPF